MADKKTIKPFAEPGFTMFNNCILDHIMPKLRPNAWKVICVAIRQTWGWEDETTESGRREEDEISYSQFMGKTGIGSKSTLSNAIKECMNAGYLKRRQTGRHPGTGKPIYSYGLNRGYELEIASTKTVPEASTETVLAESEASTESVPVSGDPSTETVHTKETLIKETQLKEKKESLSSSKKIIVDQIIEQTQTHPDQFDLGRQSEIARAEAGGNYATPAQAGGDDLAASCAYTLFCEMQKQMPTTKERESMILELSEILKPTGASIEEVEIAFGIMAKDFVYRVGNYSIFQVSFKHDLKTCIARARAKTAQRAAPHHQPESALLSQEALQERRAAQPPPPQDDDVGAIIKADLKMQMGRNEFQQYVWPTRFTRDDSALVIIAPDVFTRDWLENRLGKIIKQALAGIGDGPEEVRFDLK